jgi:hypothetical protein
MTPSSHAQLRVLQRKMTIVPISLVAISCFDDLS